jgi:hypothetical protein
MSLGEFFQFFVGGLFSLTEPLAIFEHFPVLLIFVEVAKLTFIFFFFVRFGRLMLVIVLGQCYLALSRLDQFSYFRDFESWLPLSLPIPPQQTI